MDTDERQKIALWRMGVLGPLVSARLRHGDRQAHFAMAAERVHERPDGQLVRLSPRTIETWYRAYTRGGFGALMPSGRSDAGTSRVLLPELVDLVLRSKREKPRRSVRQIIAILERAGRVDKGVLSRSMVHRLLRAAGISTRPRRHDGEKNERRSFLPERAGDLWLGDAMHGPLVVHHGRLAKAYLLTHLDAATRFCPHSAFYISEGMVDHEHGLREAFMRHGLPRTYYVDQGSAYTADSLRLICAELGVRLQHTKVRDAEAKGAIERWHRTWRAEVGDELPAEPLTLEDLNAKHWAWLHAVYHDRVHTTTGRKPREHFLADDRFIRSVPRGVRLDLVFLHRARRKVRKDGTVRWGGGLLEVQADLCGQEVELRFEPRRRTHHRLAPAHGAGDRPRARTVVHRRRRHDRRHRRPRPHAAQRRDAALDGTHPSAETTRSNRDRITRIIRAGTVNPIRFGAPKCHDGLARRRATSRHRET